MTAGSTHVMPASGDRPVLLNDLAFARSGDKGNDSDVTVFARSEAAYRHLARVLTAEVVKAHYGDLVAGEVSRWEVPNVWALKFLLPDALAGGGPASLRADNLGKALAGAILRLAIDAPPSLGRAPHPPGDPYAGAGWRVPTPSSQSHQVTSVARAGTTTDAVRKQRSAIGDDQSSWR
ncbi:MAG TPA: hypothetical protein VMM13_00705 [Euzebya sp.]|nr:hypothetical protein [Euzebya sp.]